MSRAERLDPYISENNLEAVWFARPTNFAWLTGGSNVVSHGSEVGEAAAGYDGESITVVTNNIEANRLRDEQVAESVDIETYEWYESSLSETVRRVSPTPAAADFGIEGFDPIDASPLRQPLSESDIERYRKLGTDTAEAVESVCREIDAMDTERSVAARLRATLEERGCAAPVVLVGGGHRAKQYRHLPATSMELGEYVVVSVVSQRGGLHASCTRTVAFDPPEWLERHHEAAMTVQTAALAASQQAGRDGGTVGDVFETIQRTYADAGFEGEWRSHHQGGAIGYAGREWFAEPELDVPVELPMAFGWNPTVQGAKSEGTVLVTEGNVESLTSTGEWPMRKVTTDGLEMERHAILNQ